MNKRQFIKTSILGAIGGLIAPKIAAQTLEKPEFKLPYILKAEQLKIIIERCGATAEFYGVSFGELIGLANRFMDGNHDNRCPESLGNVIKLFIIRIHSQDIFDKIMQLYKYEWFDYSSNYSSYKDASFSFKLSITTSGLLDNSTLVSNNHKWEVARVLGGYFNASLIRSTFRFL